MKKLFKWPLVIVTIVIIAIILYLVLTVIFDTKWLDLKRETYENSRYNFSLKYPENWILGETEANNAGQELYSPDNEVSCYAYGFANALMNDKGEPQTLNEFIDWLTYKDNGDFLDIKDVLRRNNSIFAGKPAISFLIKQETTYKEAIYVLGKETGIGFFCVYPDMETISEYADEFNQMIKSFEIKIDLNGETAKMGTENCVNLLNGAVEPLKDFETFTDTKYTEVTITSKKNWDKNMLPKKVIDLENKGYGCYPMPMEFENTVSGENINTEPVVIKVEWQCELKYSDWKYLEEDSSELAKYKNNGFNCEKQECFLDNNQTGATWLCAK